MYITRDQQWMKHTLCAHLYPKCLITLGLNNVIDIMRSTYSFYQSFDNFFSHSESIEVKVTCLSPLSLPLLLHSLTLDLMFIR